LLTRDLLRTITGVAMMLGMIIRAEQREDAAAVAIVVERAFGQADEARLVDRLRADGDAVISLVAIVEDIVAGHVMLSRMAAPFRALGLAPVSVSPDYQRSGIGRALVEAGLKQARERGWQAVFVLGDPAYYERFGFRLDLAQGFSSPYAGAHFMVLPLGAELPARRGRIDYAPAFASLG
jgi:putative acetyltransferase